jgi:hypothetical protein
VTCDGADTRRDGFEFLLAVKGAQSKTETKRIATRVHRTHKGPALAGRSTGGRTYGYRPVPILNESRKDAYGRPLVIGATRVIDPEAAKVVVKIFEWYANGVSPRGIAARLNAEGVPSPGAAWQRKTRRTDAKWLASAIHGDPKRGSGILNCETYVGRVVWNRRQMKKRPGTSKRVAMIRTAADLITREEPALRIISDELWQRVKDRQSMRAEEFGTRVVKGLRKARVRRPGGGRPSRYLLSGLLHCAECEAGFVLSNGTRYQCASHVNGGDAACPVSLSLPRQLAEDKILNFTRTQLFHPERLAELERLFRQQQSQPVDYTAQLAKLDKEARNLTAAIKAGGEIATLVEALKSVQGERAKLQAAMAARTPVPRAAMEPAERRAQRVLEQIEGGGDVGREALRQVFPEGFRLERAPSGKHFVAVGRDGVEGLFWDFHAASLAALTAGEVGMSFRTHR